MVDDGRVFAGQAGLAAEFLQRFFDHALHEFLFVELREVIVEEDVVIGFGLFAVARNRSSDECIMVGALPQLKAIGVIEFRNAFGF